MSKVENQPAANLLSKNRIFDGLVRPHYNFSGLYTISGR